MELKHIVPWGRTLDEYQHMFMLSPADLQKSILGCGDGPASFNAELSARGGKVVSIDPIYAFSKEQIATRIEEVAQEVMQEIRKKKEDFVWKNITNPDELYAIRMSAMEHFLADYERGKHEGRYTFQTLPSLSFETEAFDLALSSHFLFLYSEHLDECFHKDAIEEMLRVANEVRIFPIVSLDGAYSKHLAGVMGYFKNSGYRVEIVATSYEFQKGGYEMLQIQRV